MFEVKLKSSASFSRGNENNWTFALMLLVPDHNLSEAQFAEQKKIYRYRTVIRLMQTSTLLWHVRNCALEIYTFYVSPAEAHSTYVCQRGTVSESRSVHEKRADLRSWSSTSWRVVRCEHGCSQADSDEITVSGSGVSQLVTPAEWRWKAPRAVPAIWYIHKEQWGLWSDTDALMFLLGL